MTDTLFQLLLLCPLLCLVQLVAALPWLALIDPRLIRDNVTDRKRLLKALGGVVLIGVGLALYLNSNSDPDVMAGWGRGYFSILQLQILAAVIVGFFALLLALWPKGGAVALSTFREGVRQPMFWILLLAGILLLGASPFIPYFTFGEDLKMVKDLGYITIMFAAALFAVLTASLSITEEIEGRTAVTVMSKPISRRNFLLGKFLGILLGAGLLTLLLGWWLVWIVLFKEVWEPVVGGRVDPDPSWVLATAANISSAGPIFDFVRGQLLWLNDSVAVLAGLVISFGQVMILSALSVSLATRVPTLVNAVVCLAVYFLGHLTPILSAIGRRNLPLIQFFADVFDTVLPALDQFDMGPAVVRYAPLPPGDFALYTVQVSLYAVLYTAVALLFGLILFEDRDVA